MKRILYAILIFFGVAASNYLLCSEKEKDNIPKKEKNGHFNNEQEALAIVKQAWKALKGSERLTDEEIESKMSKAKNVALRYDLLAHIGSFKYHRLPEVVRNPEYYIPAISDHAAHNICPMNHYELRRCPWYRFCGEIYFVNNFQSYFINRGLISLDPKHIIYFDGHIKFLSKKSSNYSNWLISRASFLCHDAPTKKEEQTHDVKQYFQWLKNSKKRLSDFHYEFEHGLVGYSDGTWQWIVHPYHMYHLKKLSEDQLLLIKVLYTENGLRKDFLMPLRIYGNLRRVFFTLPKYMQKNLINNYNLALDEQSPAPQSGFFDYIMGALGMNSF